MIDETARIIKDRILGPTVRAIPAAVSPSMITLLSLPFGLAAAVLAGFDRSGLAVAFFAVNRILDGLDGLVARTRGAQSDLGGYLDILVDFVVYAAIPIGVWWGAAGGGAGSAAPGMSAPAERGWPLVLLLAVFYVNAASWMYLSAVIEKRRANAAATASFVETASRDVTSVTMPTGLIEGTETIVFYLLFLLLPGWWVLLFLAMAAATSVSIVQRVVWAARTLRG